MSAVVSDYEIARKQFEMFVEVRGWFFMKFGTNIKNPTQYVGKCLDGAGEMQNFLISQNGKYYQHNKQTEKWNPVPYVLEVGE